MVFPAICPPVRYAIANAQIIPDTTLPVNSNITPQGNTFIIEGGTTSGSNLFHSFTQFSVPTKGTAFFNNGETIQNIFSRITGRSISNIDGLIKANGTANLFLINPNGIIFGPNASLNIGGSFLATTANSIIFNDNTRFSATNPQAPPLLTVNVPIGLQFGSNPGRIINQSQATIEEVNNSIGSPLGLAVFPGQTLAIVGGDVILENGNLTAFEGRIELGSVGGNGIVNLTSTEAGWKFGYEQVQSFGNIELSQESVVDASGFPPLLPDEEGTRGGDIQIRGNRITLHNSGIATSNYASVSGGNLTITANSIELSGTLINPQPMAPDGSDLTVAGGLFTQTFNSGDSGNLIVNTKELIVRDGAQISADTFASGRGGNLTVIASDSVTLTGRTSDGLTGSGLFSQTQGSGDAGNLSVTTKQLIVRDGAEISSVTIGVGNAGSLTIETKELLVQNRGQIAVSTLGEKSGGNIIVNTEKLLLQDGGQILALTLGEGKGGMLIVNASESIEMVGTGLDASPSGLFTQSQKNEFINSPSLGNAGNLTVSTERMILKDGAAISADTDLNGKGGSIIINARDFVELNGVSAVVVPLDFSPAVRFDGRLPSRITAIAQGTGSAGNLTINTRRLTVQDGAITSVNARLGGGTAGNLNVQAAQIRVSNGSAIAAETASGEGGNIKLESPDIQLRRNSQITTTAGTANLQGNGGNITIRTDTIVGLQNSDISANSFDGNGGVIQINTQGIFGLEPRTRTELENLFNSSDISQFNPSNLSTSDITAISRTNPSLSGFVNIQTPDVDPTQGLVELPENIVDVASLIEQNFCRVAQGSQFTVTGSGGLPASPNEALTNNDIWEDTSVPQLSTTGKRQQLAINNSNAEQKIVEAEGWIINRNGEVVLVASSNIISPNLWLTPGCKIR
ncbi:MAG: filamentous hemagglutinin N-terminal domain-containing protein [Phormidium sp.]